MAKQTAQDPIFWLEESLKIYNDFIDKMEAWPIEYAYELDFPISHVQSTKIDCRNQKYMFEFLGQYIGSDIQAVDKDEMCEQILTTMDAFKEVIFKPFELIGGQLPKSIQRAQILLDSIIARDFDISRKTFDKITLIDGFICEGKSEWLENNKKPEFEGSEFFRLKLDVNKQNLSYMPAEYFKVYILFDLLLSLFAYQDEFYLYRYYSHLFFNKLPCSFDCKSYCVENSHKIIPKDCSTFSLEAIYKLIALFHKDKTPFYFKLFMNSKFYFKEFSFKSSRRMEKTQYFPGEIRNIAGFFYSKLFTTYITKFAIPFNDEFGEIFEFLHWSLDNVLVMPIFFSMQVVNFKFHIKRREIAYILCNNINSFSGYKLLDTVTYCIKYHFYFTRDFDARFLLLKRGDEDEHKDLFLDINKYTPERDSFLNIFEPFTLDNSFKNDPNFKLCKIEKIIDKVGEIAVFKILSLKSTFPDECNEIQIQPCGCFYLKLELMHSRIQFYFLKYEYVRDLVLDYDYNIGSFIIINNTMRIITVDLTNALYFYCPFWIENN